MKKETIKSYLEREPRARERANKNRALGNLLIEKYHLDIPKDKMADIVGDVLNGDRYWRMTTKEHPALRGKDWHTKDIVEQEYEMSLGYEVNYKNNIKQI